MYQSDIVIDEKICEHPTNRVIYVKYRKRGFCPSRLRKYILHTGF